MDNKNIHQYEAATPIKLVFATKLKEIMKDQSINQTELARRMHTSRTAVARVLDPENSSITLQTLAKAAHAVNYSFTFKLESVDQPIFNDTMKKSIDEMKHGKCIKKTVEELEELEKK